MPFQMALDEIFFREAIEASRRGKEVTPILRFYYASEPWISVGYAYAGWKQFREHGTFPAPGDLVSSGYPICRRMTGGGVVLHGRDLMFTIIASKDLHESFKSVRLSYLKIHELLKSALENLDLKPRFYRCDEALPKGKECFRFPIATDLALGRRKIAGGGQKRSLGILLHQESVQLDRNIQSGPVMSAFKEEIQKFFQQPLQPADLEPEVLEQAGTLGKKKYSIPPNSIQPVKEGTGCLL